VENVIKKLVQFLTVSKKSIEDAIPVKMVTKKLFGENAKKIHLQFLAVKPIMKKEALVSIATKVTNFQPKKTNVLELDMCMAVRPINMEYANLVKPTTN